jgi:hypothetical protein
MSTHPLTHHEILDLVEPFTLYGRHVDLAASNRIERRLLFKPVEHAGQTQDSPGLRETLQLENRDSDGDSYRLTRTLTHADGLEARLQTEGREVAELLTRIAAIEPWSQFRSGTGFVTALSYRLEAAAGDTPAPPILTRGEAQVAGLRLILKARTVRGYPADVELHDSVGDSIELPEDLLAVIGWDWARLVRDKEGWSSKLRLRGREPERTRRAELKLHKTVEHLAQTLAEPPARFHQRRLRARWGVVFRRAIPLLAGLGLCGAAMGASQLDIPENSALRLLILNSPPILLALAFCMQELPRFEIPPMPRLLTAPTWRQPPAPEPSK